MEAEYLALKLAWLAGERDRELGLHLLFFAWMHWADPPFVTGLEDDPEAERLWLEVFDSMGGDASTDAEFLFVAGIMAETFPHVLGEERQWAARGLAMRCRAMKLQSRGVPLGTFDNRGEYGEYFSHQLRGHLKEH